MKGQKTTISTTITTQEQAAIKKLGLKYNYLIRLGLNTLSGSAQAQNNERLERLEKGLDDYRRRYFEVKRSLMEYQFKKEEGDKGVSS